jgi:hypothetical protein
LLAAAVGTLSFQPPEPFSFDLSSLTSTVSPGPGLVIPVWRYFLFGCLLLLILAVLVFILDPELRKRLLIRMLRLGLVVAAVWYLITLLYNRGTLQKLLRMPVSGGGLAAALPSPAAAPVFIPPQINPWLVFAVSFAIGLALILIGWGLYSRRPRPGSNFARDEVGAIAKAALAELEAGQNWDDAIVQAYVRMNEVVVSERGLLRQPGSTPREFCQRMERIGLPGEAVRTLTGLFERVRYGGGTSTPQERDLAAAALSAIVHACRRVA